MPNDHLHGGVEGAYSIFGRDGWLVVDGAEIPITAGNFIAITREFTRFVKARSDYVGLVGVRS